MAICMSKDFTELRGALLEVFARHIPDPTKCESLAEVVAEMVQAVKAGADPASIFRQTDVVQRSKNKTDFPAKAPQLWSDRPNKRGENPAAFIRRVYAPWLETMSRVDLFGVDRALYNAYASWIRPERHPEDDLKLPTRSDKITADLKLIETVDLQGFSRLHDAKRMREKRSRMKLTRLKT